MGSGRQRALSRSEDAGSAILPGTLPVSGGKYGAEDAFTFWLNGNDGLPAWTVGDHSVLLCKCLAGVRDLLSFCRKQPPCGGI